jgi:23S rRNA (pseudouridine1915-N3)-methyltransferase
MKFTIVAIGTRMPEWVEAGFAEYTRRMPRSTRVELVEIRPERRDSGRSTEEIRAAEAQRIRERLPRGCRRVLLDERGESHTTRSMAGRLSEWMAEGRDIAFVIGGADGLDPELFTKADAVWSLSPLTLPHGLVRVVLAEQLYRAVSLLNNHPYHRD